MLNNIEIILIKFRKIHRDNFLYVMNTLITLYHVWIVEFCFILLIYTGFLV